MYARATLLLTSLQISVRRLVDSQSGATVFEYGLIATCIAILLIGTMTTLGSNVNASFQGWADFFMNQ